MAGQEMKYRQVIDWVRENVENGTFREGDKLLSENELSARFSLSRQTVRRALGELVDLGMVTRMQGSGTYIGAAPVQGRERRMNIAVISTFNETYIFPSILKGIGQVLTGSGYTLQVYFTDNRLSHEEAVLKLLLEKDDIDGLIVEPVKSSLPNPNIRYYEEIMERGIKLLFFNASYPALDCPCVRIDDTSAARTAAKLLVDAGHKKIGAVFKSDDGQGPLRYQGYLEALVDAGLKTDQKCVIWLDTPASSDMELLADYLLGRLEGCTGVVCYNDQIAYQLIGLALEKGVRIPEDLSVVGIDDSYLAGVCRVPYDSVAHPKEALGKKVAENLVAMIRDPSFDGNCLMESQPVTRGSIAVKK